MFWGVRTDPPTANAPRSRHQLPDARGPLTATRASVDLIDMRAHAQADPMCSAVPSSAGGADRCQLAVHAPIQTIGSRDYRPLRGCVDCGDELAHEGVVATGREADVETRPGPC